MKRLLTTVALGAALAASSAAAEIVIVYDAELGEKFAAKRDIVDMVQKTYGDAVVYESGAKLPDSVVDELTPRTMVPQGTQVEAVPADLAGKLPHTEVGTTWHKIGKNLVEAKPDGMIVMVVYDVL